MDYEGHYCVTINRTQYNNQWILKWDLYDHNISKLGNNNEFNPDLRYAAFSTFFNIQQTLEKIKPKFVTFVTNWEQLITDIYTREFTKDYVSYFKELFLPYNHIVINVFDTEIINEFYNN